MHYIRRFCAIIGLLGTFLNPSLASNPGDSASRIVGLWQTQKPERNARIQIQPCSYNKERFCGKIVWLQEPTYDNGTPKVDKNNEDANLRSRPLLGMEILSGFTEIDEENWEDGTIYNPEDGKVYNCQISIGDPHPKTGADQLNVRGYVGISLFGKTQTWVRLSGTTMQPVN